MALDTANLEVAVRPQVRAVQVLSKTGARRRRKKEVWQPVGVPSIPAKTTALDDLLPSGTCHSRQPMYPGHRYQSRLAVSLPDIPSIVPDGRRGRRKFEKINFTKTIYHNPHADPTPLNTTNVLPPIRGSIHNPPIMGLSMVENIINTTDRTVEFIERDGQVYVNSLDTEYASSDCQRGPQGGREVQKPNRRQRHLASYDSAPIAESSGLEIIGE